MRGLIVPGLNGSGPEHWQTLWEERYGFERVMQRDWGNPSADEWVQTLDAAIGKHEGKVVLVAHSLGCSTVLLWAKRYAAHTGKVHAALLVAPPDIVASMTVPESTKAFLLRQPGALPFPSILVGSENDPYIRLETARRLARVIGSRFVNAGPFGHINVDSGHGPWPQGEALLQELLPSHFGKKEILHDARFQQH